MSKQSDKLKIKENNMATTHVKVKSADEVINEISEVLSQADGKFIEHIANQVLSRPVKYTKDSLFETRKKRTMGKKDIEPITTERTFNSLDKVKAALITKGNLKGYIKGIVECDLNELIGEDMDRVNEILTEKLVPDDKAYLLQAMSYHAVGCDPVKGTVFIEITTLADELVDEWGDEEE